MGGNVRSPFYWSLALSSAPLHKLSFELRFLAQLLLICNSMRPTIEDTAKEVAGQTPTHGNNTSNQSSAATISTRTRHSYHSARDVGLHYTLTDIDNRASQNCQINVNVKCTRRLYYYLYAYINIRICLYYAGVGQ